MLWQERILHQERRQNSSYIVHTANWWSLLLFHRRVQVHGYSWWHLKPTTHLHRNEFLTPAQIWHVTIRVALNCQVIVSLGTCIQYSPDNLTSANLHNFYSHNSMLHHWLRCLDYSTKFSRIFERIIRVPLYLNRPTTPMRYGLPASPNAWDMRIWNALAVDRRVGITIYCKKKCHKLVNVEEIKADNCSENILILLRWNGLWNYGRSW